jgi:hypothetical protein
MAVPMDRRTYLLLALLSVMALSGLIIWLMRVLLIERREGRSEGEELAQVEPKAALSSVQQQVLILMGSTVLLILLGYGWYNLTFVQFQGRYLFPGLIPLGLFFSIGLNEILRRPWTGWLVTGLSLSLIGTAATTAFSGDLDKWAIMIIGLVLILVVGRLWIKFHWTTSNAWMLAICYAGLALLTLSGPFWFVVPYL